MKTFDYAHFEQNDLIDYRTSNLSENNLNLIEQVRAYGREIQNRIEENKAIIGY